MTGAPAPRLEHRTTAAVGAALDANRRGYLPEWTTRHDAGTALNGALARNLAIQHAGLNAAPLRLQLAYLESIGANLLPAQPARAPVVFSLLDNASVDAVVAAGSRVGAVLPPPAPSLDGSADAPVPTAPEFFTEQQITAMRGTLAAVYSLDPQADSYADHTSATPGGFAVFAPKASVPHRLYLGHAALFALTGLAGIELSLTFGAVAPDPGGGTGQRPLLLDWEYLSVDGWLPLDLVDDGTARFTCDGKITLAKPNGPDSKTDAVAGLTNNWIRATVSARTPSARIVSLRAAPNGPTPHAIDVEAGFDLLAGDVVTVDGSARATVVQRVGNTLYLDVALAGVVPGEFVTLADALPPLRPDGADAAGALAQLDVIRARVAFTQSGLQLDRACLESFVLDIGKDFYPFGEQPRPFAACYLACKNAFTRTGARIEIAFTYSRLYPEYADGTATAPALAIEFFSAGRWLRLNADHELDDGTKSLTEAAEGTRTGTIAFVCPDGWDESELNGEKQRWLRLRLADGDYGRPLSVSVDPDPADSTQFAVTSTPSTLKPPVIARVDVSYVYFTQPAPPEACVCENDFAFVDRSEDARWPRQPFAPFTPVSDRTPALHLGFSAPPPAALVSLLVHVLAPAPEGDPQPFVWDYWGAAGWTELSVRDTTFGLRRTGLVQFVGAPDALARDGLGGALYRIRARLKDGLASAQQQFDCGGVWLNAVWASHGRRAERETLGTSNGAPDQTFALAVRGAQPAAPVAVPATARDFDAALDVPPVGVPVQAGEIVEVREWAGRGDDWQSLVQGVDASDLRFETDARDPSVKTAVWVRWTAQPHLYRSGPGDRHYVVERATGVFRFPAADGFVPPAGAPIVVTYVTGGGNEGNVPAGALRELRSSVGFVQSVTNPLAASGGAAPEPLRSARDRGMQAVRHRDRAVACEDYEWIARGASSEVAQARTLPLDGPDGGGSRGFVSMVIVPRSPDTRPMPSARLLQTVLDTLAARVPAGIAGGVRVLAPSYVAVGVRADVQPAVAEEAATVEARVRTRLGAFLHPVTGGVEGLGWAFGRAVYLSDVAACLATVEGVAAIELLQLRLGQAVCGDAVEIAAHEIVCAGDLQLKIVLPSVPYALA